VGFRILDGHQADRLPAVRELFAEYAASLEVDLSFQEFDRELAELPGDYVPPAGRLLLALDGDEPAGCVALRPYEPEVCEMKRLYVRPAFQGAGLGRRLAEAIVEAGRDAGYRTMRLDTLPTMAAARGLYRAMGFEEIDAYRPNPVHGTTYFELRLR
jgi:ribosomal protein S18 acetylase RimI-like enzyme